MCARVVLTRVEQFGKLLTSFVVNHKDDQGDAGRAENMTPRGTSSRSATDGVQLKFFCCRHWRIMWLNAHSVYSRVWESRLIQELCGARNQFLVRFLLFSLLPTRRPLRDALHCRFSSP